MQAKIADHLLFGLRNIYCLSSVKSVSLHPPLRLTSKFLSLSFDSNSASNRRYGKNVFPNLHCLAQYGKSDCIIRNFSQHRQVSDKNRDCLSRDPMLVPLRWTSASS